MGVKLIRHAMIRYQAEQVYERDISFVAYATTGVNGLSVSRPSRTAQADVYFDR